MIIVASTDINDWAASSRRAKISFIKRVLVCDLIETLDRAKRSISQIHSLKSFKVRE